MELFVKNTAELISNYVLGNTRVEDLPYIAEIALSEGLVSESTSILAGLNKDDNSFQILEYFEKFLKEQKIELPTKIEGARILTKFYLNNMVENL